MSNARLTDTLKELIAIANQIDVNLLVSDSVWDGIQSSTIAKTEQLYAGKKSKFEYKGEFKDISKELKRYIEFFESPQKFVDEFDKMQPDYKKFAQSDTKGKMDFLKDEISTIVSKSLKQWGTLAARIGFGMPLKIAEEKEIFFRRKRLSPDILQPG